ncbi:MAG TPA: hypothetical protein PK562_05980 [Candidatus Omnitrophota bacterium]|nr:hypothetical protein [Candidatus Omnitrophota bacterium]
MKVSKFLAVLISVTVLSLVYVWQQNEILRLAYERQKNYAFFQDLLDANSSLRYNLTHNTSVTKIAGRISQESDFTMPDNYCLVKVPAPARQTWYAQGYTGRKQTLVSRVFGIRRQAEAKTIDTAVRSLPRD